MKLKHINENSSMHPDDIYASVKQTIADLKAKQRPSAPNPNAVYPATGDAQSQEDARFRREWHANQDEREARRGHGRLEEEPDELAGRHTRTPEPHPYRKHGTPLNRPPVNPDYPTKPFDKKEWVKSYMKEEDDEQLNEISNEVLAKYKTAAGNDARKSDAAGDTARGNKRFSGIVKATNKQFDNDAKKRAPVKTSEGSMGGINRSAPAVDVSYEKVLDNQGDAVQEEIMTAYENVDQIQKPIGYVLVDGQSQGVIGKYGPAQRGRANARRDKLDNEHGAYRYRVTPVYAGEKYSELFQQTAPVSENKHRTRTAATQAGQPNFTDILNKQNQDKTAAQPAKRETVTIPYHGWDIKYRPAAEGQKTSWVVIKGEKIAQKGESDSDESAVRDAEAWIKKGAGQNQTMSKNATIDFNSKFVSTFAPNGEQFYSTFVSQNGQPYFVISSEPHEGLTKSSIRSGANFPSIHIGPRIATPVGLQPHGRYVIDLQGKEELEDGGVFMYPLIFQGIIQDKNEREHLGGPGFTVAYSRGVDEALDPWHGYTKDDKKANAQARAPKYAKQGSVEVPFSELVCDTIRKHGIRWAFQFYVVKHGLPPRQFKIFAKDALENRE